MQLAVVEKLAAGIPEAEFWEAFAQCIACRLVMFRECVMQHECLAFSSRKRKRGAVHPPTRRVQARLELSPGDVPEAPGGLRSLRRSATRARNSLLDASTSGAVREEESTDDADSGDETEIIPASDEVEAPLSSDFEFPSLIQVLESTRTPQTQTASP